MGDYRDSQTCKAKVGLLFLRDCGSMVKTTCVTCGRPVCRVHSIESDKGIVCPECGAEDQSIEEEAPMMGARTRNRYYSGYGYTPYYYGHSHYYSDNDYRTFENQEIVYEEPPENSSDADLSDDPMES